MKLLIGVMGQARSGKDTMADYLCEKYSFVRIALADPIKRVCMDAYDMTENQLWGDQKEGADIRYPLDTSGVYYLTPRKACQLLGTEVGRAIYSGTWVDKLIRDAGKILEGGHTYSRTKGVRKLSSLQRILFRNPKGVVVPDLRFRNEMDAIRKAGGIIVRLKRAGKDGDVGIKGHASEEEQKTIPDTDVDYVLEVMEGLEVYHLQIDSLMAGIRRGWHNTYKNG